MTYHTCSAETSRKSGVLTFPEPLGPPRPVAGNLYFALRTIENRALLGYYAASSSNFVLTFQGSLSEA